MGDQGGGVVAALLFHAVATARTRTVVATMGERLQDWLQAKEARETNGRAWENSPSLGVGVAVGL